MESECLNDDLSHKSKIDDEKGDIGTDPSREQWSRKAEYVLSLVGYCVGLGNIWRFPYICMRNGGGAFLIPFFFFLISCGFPLYFLEVCHGQFLGKGAANAWEVCPLFQGIGIGTVLATVVFAYYYNMLVTWIIYYIFNSFFSPLPFNTCGNSWNTEHCQANRSILLQQNGTPFSNFSDGNITFLLNETSQLKSEYLIISPEEEFWQNNVLQISTGLDDIRSFPWHLPLCFLAAWTIVFVCVIKGVKSVGKVVYFTATMPYVLLFVLLIRGLTLPGGIDGVIYYLRPDFKKLLESQVWLEAAIQVFYSLGPGWGVLVTMSSYNKFSNNCLRDAICLTFVCEGTSIFGGMAVFSVLGYMAAKTGQPIETVVSSGPGLGFIAYPEAIAHLPLPNLWAFLFFLMLLTTALDTQFVSLEVIRSAVLDSFPSLRGHQIICTAAISIVLFLLGLPMCTQAGVYIFQLVDWYVAAIAMFVFGILESFIFGWIYGIEQFSKDVSLMVGRGIPRLLKFCLCFITPVVLTIVLVITLLSYKAPTYGSYNYPGYAQVIGWFLACLPLLPLPILAAKEIRKSKEDSLINKIKDACRPSNQWKPNCIECQSDYRMDHSKPHQNLLKKTRNMLNGFRIS